MIGSGILQVVDMLGNTIAQLQAQLADKDQQIAELTDRIAQLGQRDDAVNSNA